jgi:hypothetical protein
MTKAVLAQMALEGTAGHPGQERAKCGRANIRAHRAEDVVDKLGRVPVKRS